jgi:ribosomal protein L7/L12
LEKHFPIEKVGYHPAVLVLVGIVGGNAADAEDLGVEREVGRTVLLTASAVASRRRGVARESCLEGENNPRALTRTRCASDMAAWSIPTGMSWASPPGGAEGTDMVAKVGVSEAFCQKKITIIKLVKGVTNLRFDDASVAVTKLMVVEGDGRVEATRVVGEREKEGKRGGDWGIINTQQQEQPQGRSSEKLKRPSDPRWSGEVTKKALLWPELDGGLAGQRGAARGSKAARCSKWITKIVKHIDHVRPMCLGKQPEGGRRQAQQK